MDWLNERFPNLQDLWPFLATLAVVAATLWLTNFYLQRKVRYAAGKQFVKPLVMLILSLALLVVLILALPVSESTRNELLKLISLAVSAVIAFSSTTFIGNAMAGLMLRAIGSFRAGDFIRVDAHFGRVSERGLFHTEIQTEFRDLITLPNLYLITHPVAVIRSSGTIVHAEVSLGYDVPRESIEEALKEAAEAAGLKEAYVQVLELQDFSVLYRVNGLLEESKELIPMRSHLRKEMLDRLHARGIEIASPTIMNQRRIAEDHVFRPVEKHKRGSARKISADVLPEAVFDKAEEAESREQVVHRLDQVKKELEALKAADPKDEKRLKELEAQQKTLEKLSEKLNGKESK